MAMTQIVAGNTARAYFNPVPASGSVDLANVSARAVSQHSGEVKTGTCATTGTNAFYADFEIEDTQPSGVWRVRFEVSTPKIALEDDDMLFQVVASEVPNP